MAGARYLLAKAPSHSASLGQRSTTWLSRYRHVQCAHRPPPTGCRAPLLPGSAVPVCSSLHLFQVVATSCFNRSNGCWFLIVISLLVSASQKKLWKDGPEVIQESRERLVAMHSSPLRPGGFARPSLRLHVSWARPKHPVQRPGAYLHGRLEPQPSVPAHAWALQVHAHPWERDEGDGAPHPGRPRSLRG